MTNRLTYADRELLLRTFDGLKAEWNGNDDELLTRTCDWAKRLVPSCGFEHSLIRDIASLSQYLIARKEEHDLATIARGGLLFILSAEQQGPSRLQAEAGPPADGMRHWNHPFRNHFCASQEDEQTRGLWNALMAAGYAEVTKPVGHVPYITYCWKK